MVNAGAQWFANELKAILKTRVVGPDFPLVSRIQNYYLKNILVKIERERPPGQVKQIIYQTWIKMKGRPDFKSLYVIFDVDPY